MVDRARGEIFWWLGIVIWAALLAFWEPEPPFSLADAPSASPSPGGFGIFHDLVAREARGARRHLGGPDELPASVGVLVVLSPFEVVPSEDREKMLDWVAESGGTLVVGHPLRGDGGEPVTLVHESAVGLLAARSSGESRQATLSFVAAAGATRPIVPPFVLPVEGALSPACPDARILLVDDQGAVMALVEPFGSGKVIQIADAGILDNAAIGWRRSHLFAAALVDEAGRDSIWAFDESYEGIRPEPSFLRLVGSSRFRPVFLQAGLLLLVAFWWRSARMGRPVAAPIETDAREATSRARVVGDFYRRARRGRWALERVLGQLRTALGERGAPQRARDEALALVAWAEERLASGIDDIEGLTGLIRKMALVQRALSGRDRRRKR